MHAQRLTRMYHRAIYVHGVTGLLQIARRWWIRRTWEDTDTFDREYGVETTGGDAAADLALADPRHAIYGSRSQPSSASAAQQLLAAHADPDRTFIDVGCGKGRVVLLASLYPFRRIIGVDYGKNLVETAQRNLARWRHPDQRCRDLSIAWADATVYEFPAEPLLIYLFNPFERPVMDRFVRHLDASLRAHPRPCTVIYQNPVHAEAWEHSRFVCADRRTWWARYHHCANGCG